MNACARALFAFRLLAATAAFAQQTPLAAGLNEAVVSVPLATAAGEQLELVATTFHPRGAGPFPLIVLSHGSPADGAARARMGRYRRIPQVREFIDRGFAVIVPMRRAMFSPRSRLPRGCRSSSATASFSSVNLPEALPRPRRRARIRPVWSRS